MLHLLSAFDSMISLVLMSIFFYFLTKKNNIFYLFYSTSTSTIHTPQECEKCYVLKLKVFKSHAILTRYNFLLLFVEYEVFIINSRALCNGYYFTLWWYFLHGSLLLISNWIVIMCSSHVFHLQNEYITWACKSGYFLWLCPGSVKVCNYKLQVIGGWCTGSLPRSRARPACAPLLTNAHIWWRQVQQTETTTNAAPGEATAHLRHYL